MKKDKSLNMNKITIFIFIVAFILFIMSFTLMKKQADNSIKDTKDVTSVNIDVQSVDLKVGEEQQILATVFPINAINQKISYSSSNENVAVISGNGLITGIGIGTTTITATSHNGISTSIVVIVSANNVDRKDKPVITINDPQGIKGKNNWFTSNVSVTIEATEADYIKYCYSTGIKCNPNIVIRSGEKITLREGIFKIYVEAVNFLGKTTAESEVIMIDPTIPTFDFDYLSTTEGAKAVIDCKDFTSGIATCAGFKTDLVVLDKLKEDKTIEIFDKAGNKITAKIKVNKNGLEYEAILLK